jgi:uncharacterized membrane protein
VLVINPSGRVYGKPVVPPVEAMPERGRFVQSANRLTARLGKPPREEGDLWVYLIKTPAGVARLTATRALRTQEVEWTIEAPGLDALPWALLALNKSTARLAASVTGAEGATGEDTARQATAAYAAFTARRTDGECGPQALALESQRDGMAEDLVMALPGGGLAARLGDLAQRWERAQVSADAEEGVEVDYRDGIETVRALAALAAGA